jgi:hypothetical protein
MKVLGGGPVGAFPERMGPPDDSSQRPSGLGTVPSLIQNALKPTAGAIG